MEVAITIAILGTIMSIMVGRVFPDVVIFLTNLAATSKNPLFTTFLFPPFI